MFQSRREYVFTVSFRHLLFVSVLAGNVGLSTSVLPLRYRYRAAGAS